MQLLTLADVPTGTGDRAFRYSRAWAIVVGVGAIAASAGLAAFGWYRGAGLAYYGAAVIVVTLVILQKLVLARFRPSNWLLRLRDDGVYVQYRSYLNLALSGDDMTVVYLPFSEIRSVRRVDERREVPCTDTDPQGVVSTMVEAHRWLEIEVTSDSAPLTKALAAERGARPRRAALYQHYPVRLLSPAVLRVEWGVVPSVDAFIDAVRQRVAVAPPVTISESYAKLDELSAEEQEQRLRQLVEEGRTHTATYLVRMLHGCDLAQAVAFVEGLSGATGRARPPFRDRSRESRSP